MVSRTTGPWAGGLDSHPSSALGQSTTAQPTPGTQSGIVPFQSGYSGPPGPYDGVPYSAQTLDQSQRMPFANRGEYVQNMLQIINLAMESVEGWWFVLAPRVKVDQFTQDVEIYSTGEYIFEPTAERVAPTYVQLKRSRFSITMDHFQLGADVLGEHLRFGRGVEELRLKLLTLVSGAVKSHKLSVLAAVLTMEDYHALRARSTTRYRSVREATMMARSRFGALTNDPEALRKIFSLLPNDFNPNMAVIPEGVALLHKWGHGKSSEFFRVGEAGLRQLNFEKQVVIDGLFPGVQVFVDRVFRPINGHGTDYIDGFRRRATLGQFAVLQNSDKTPSPYDGPTIQTVTMPTGQWTSFSMRDALMNCPRFADNAEGSIMEFTQKALDNTQSMLERAYGDSLDGDNIDAWVYEALPVPDASGRIDHLKPRLRVCEMYGEQDTRHRTEEYDAYFGKLAAQKLGLSDTELTQLRLLLDEADYLYEASGRLGEMEALYRAIEKNEDGSAVLDSEFGGIVIARVSPPRPPPIDGRRPPRPASYTRLPGTPIGAGDIFNVMSLLKQSEAIGPSFTVNYPRLRALDYKVLRAVFMKIWSSIKRYFPGLKSANADNVVFTRDTGNKDRNAMISVLRGYLERVKHPLWIRSTTMEIKEGDMMTEGTIDAGGSLLRIMKTRTFTDATVRKIEEGWQIIRPNDGLPEDEGARGTFLALVQSYIAAAEEGDGGVPGRAATAVILNWLARLAYEATEGSEKLDVPGIDALRERATAFALRVYPTPEIATSDGTQRAVVPVSTGLTIAKEAFDSYGVVVVNDKTFTATNAFTGTSAIKSGRGARDNLAQARMGAQDPETYAQRGGMTADPKNVRTGVIAREFAEQGRSRPFGADPAQYVDSRRATRIGGEFLDMDFLEPAGGGTRVPALVERQYMSRRADYLQKTLCDDPLARLMAFCFLMTPVSRKTALRFMDEGLPVPFNFIFAAAFIQQETLAMMFAEGGMNTARLHHNFTDVTNPEDGIHKEHWWNVTTWFGSKVIDPSKVIVIDDVALAGYKGGLEKCFFRRQGDLLIEGGYFDAAANRRMFVFDVPVSFDRERALTDEHNPIPLFGRHKPETFPGSFADPDPIFSPKNPHFPTWPAYDQYWDFKRINHERTYADRTYQQRKSSKYITGTLWHTRVRVWDGTKFTKAGGVAEGTAELDSIRIKGFSQRLEGLIPFGDDYPSFTQDDM